MSKYSKRKWEIEYETLKTKNMDEEIKRLQAEVDSSRRTLASIKDSNLQEYKNKSANQKANEKQINKLKMLKINMPKVANILKTRDAHKKRLEKLIKDKKSFEETIKMGNEAKKLEEELDKLKKYEERVRNALKDKNLSPENREKLNNALSDNIEKQNVNQKKFSDNQLKLIEKLNSPLAKKDFDKEIQTTRNMISKCNFIGRNLMEGKKMEEISVDLKNWEDRKFTDEAKKTEEKKEASKQEKSQPVIAESDPEKPRTEKDPKDTLENEKTEIIGKDGEGATEKDDKPAVVSEWDQKHPKLAKIKNFFKDAGNKVKEIASKVFKKEEKAEKKEEKPEKAEKKEEKRTEKLSKQEIADKKAKFYETLAVKGQYSDLPQNSKLTDALGKAPNPKEQKNNDDEGR